MRKVCFYGFVGITMGISINQILNLALSYALHLGYYAPCFVALPEIAGGELQAALLQTAVMAGMGGVIGLLAGVGKKLKMHLAWKGNVQHEHGVLGSRLDQSASFFSAAGSGNGDHHASGRLRHRLAGALRHFDSGSAHKENRHNHAHSTHARGFLLQPDHQTVDGPPAPLSGKA